MYDNALYINTINPPCSDVRGGRGDAEKEEEAGRAG